MSLKSIQERVKSCSKCPKLFETRRQSVPGYGDSQAKVLFIGLAPGRKGADLTGVPFTRDDSGILFQEMLIECGFSREKDPRNEEPTLEDVFVTNLVKCNPKTRSDAGNIKNRAPTTDEIENCKSFLMQEISVIEPKIIVPLGKKCTKNIFKGLGISGSSNWRKKKMMDDLGVFPMYHPGYIVRGGGRQRYTKRKYQTDFKELCKLLKNV